ncbi:FAD-binding protein [Actinocrispum sp. NPDC049592]|uniref:FAD-binding oxidoreductase n=1 Tax=Actinocrispum sp. NPDC049592 TaxID=3154835 RepID=UPI003438EDF8
MRILRPDDAEYEAVRRPALPNYWHVRPSAVVRCFSTADVVSTLEYARTAGLHVTPRGGGHCFAGRSSTSGVVLDLSPLNSVSVSGGVAVVGAGAVLDQVYSGLDAHGLTLPAGCGPTVGIAGLTLGGGLGLLGRRYGLTCDRLLSAEVVLTDGRVVTSSVDSEPDLFWALRGAGGGQFGVVTSLVFAPVPASPAIRFLLTWPVAAAFDVVLVWQEVAPDAPDEVSANLKITVFGVTVFGAGPPPDELLRLTPSTRDITTMPYRHLKESFDGPETGPITSKSEFFAENLPTPTIKTLLDALTPGCELNFTPMGGAYNRIPPHATAFAHRHTRFLLEHTAPTPTQAHTSWTITHPHGTGRVYPNFPDPTLPNWQTAYHAENHPRLAEIKAHYDSDRVLHFKQSL